MVRTMAMSLALIMLSLMFCKRIDASELENRFYVLDKYEKPRTQEKFREQTGAVAGDWQNALDSVFDSLSFEMQWKPKRTDACRFGIHPGNDSDTLFGIRC